MFILFCVVFAVISLFFVFKRMKGKHESIIVVIYIAVLVGVSGGTSIGVFGDVIISEFLEINEEIKITEPKIIILKTPDGLDRYAMWDNEKEQWKDIEGDIIFAEKGRKELLLREITKSIRYKNPINDFLFNSKKSVKITKEIILPKN